MISETDRISVQYNSKSHDEIEPYTWMFMEDFHQNIVPTNGPKFKLVNCSLFPTNSAFQAILMHMLPALRRRYMDDFNEIILGTIQYITNHLVQNGSMVLELVTLKDINESVFYKLVNIYGDEIKIEKGHVIQIISEEAATELNISKSIKIPKEKCFIIDFPQFFGGKVNYLKFLEEFKSLGKQSPIMNFLNNPLKEQMGYDLTDHKRIHELELWRKSKIFNWHHRSNPENTFSGYYFFYRHLNFRKSKIALRDYIIEQLKNIVSILSEKLGDKTELRIDGLLPMSRIDEKIEQWKSGELIINSLDEVL
jgi:hypothetical protein